MKMRSNSGINEKLPLSSKNEGVVITVGQIFDVSVMDVMVH